MWLEFLKFIKTLGDRISEEFQHSLKIVKLFPELDDLLRVIAVVVERLVQGSCGVEREYYKRQDSGRSTYRLDHSVNIK
jgi:hypothetical protein